MARSTRLLPLYIATTSSALAYRAGIEREFPDWPAPIFDANEHASHLIAGVTIGFLARQISENIGKLRKRAFAIGVLGATTAGALFETPLSDKLWYRDTTLSVGDIVYTSIGGVVGALCVKRANDTPLPAVVDITDVEHGQ